jgi:hypothetical protein
MFVEMEEYAALLSEGVLACFICCKIRFRLKHEDDDSFSSDVEI